MTYDNLLPKPNADTRAFWEGCQKHQLRFQKCRNCNHVRWPPSIICPICHASETEWIVASGKGIIYSYAVYHVAFHPAFKEHLPYVTAVVELDEGVHLLTNIVGSEPSDLKCDMPVEVVWDDVSDKLSLPKFKVVTQ